jgi:hypothetical protein
MGRACSTHESERGWAQDFSGETWGMPIGRSRRRWEYNIIGEACACIVIFRRVRVVNSLHIRIFLGILFIYFCNTQPGVIRAVKSRRMGWTGHVARMRARGGGHRILVGKPGGCQSEDLGVDGCII